MSQTASILRSCPLVALLVGCGGTLETTGPSPGTGSSTLAVELDVLADGAGDVAPADVLVTVVVMVKSASGDAVPDATIQAGAPGRLSPVPADANQPGRYEAVLRGYTGTWELSVRRGQDVLQGVRVAGPTYHEVRIEPYPVGAGTTPTLSWAPSAEEGVGVKLDVWRKAPDQAATYSEPAATETDSGLKVLPATSFPSAGMYEITLLRQRSTALTGPTSRGTISVQRSLPATVD